jgi:hypothetical protein
MIAVGSVWCRDSILAFYLLIVEEIDGDIIRYRRIGEESHSPGVERERDFIRYFKEVV